VDGPFEAVATINVHDPGKYQVLTLQDAMPELMDKARAVGANALIIDHFERVWSGVISSGVDVQARAIRWTREAASPVPRATAREIDLSACARIFERIGDLANTWVENHPDRAPLPSLPSRDAFLSVCGQLPDDAQLCLNRTYDAAHHDACTAKLTALPTRDRLLLDRLFLEPSESEQ
jgi:hypothetical protein